MRIEMDADEILDLMMEAAQIGYYVGVDVKDDNIEEEALLKIVTSIVKTIVQGRELSKQ